jgi:hypothetical protein
MNRTRRLLGTLAVILMAGITTMKGLTDERPVAPAAAKNAADSVQAGIASERPTALIVLCFPGAGCIVCHNSYCEYTVRV